MENNIYFIGEELIECDSKVSIERFYDYNGFVIKSTVEVIGNEFVCLN